MTNSADPDQLASSTDLDLHCLLRRGMSCSASEELKKCLGQILGQVSMFKCPNMVRTKLLLDKFKQNKFTRTGKG